MTRFELSRVTIGLVSSVVFAGSCTSTMDPLQQFAAANRAVDQWVARHPTEWAVSLGERTLYRSEFSTSCAQDGKNNLVALTYAAADTEIDFFFNCPLGPTASVEDLRTGFAFAVLTRLPHGVHLPGWTFTLYTPTSSVREAITLEPVADGGVRIHIDTPLHAIAGRSLHPSCQGPVDAPASPECHVSREHGIPLRVTLRARIDGSAL